MWENTAGCLQSKDHLMGSVESALQMSELTRAKPISSLLLNIGEIKLLLLMSSLAVQYCQLMFGQQITGLHLCGVTVPILNLELCLRLIL